MTMNYESEYDVAISFAGEDREIAEQIFLELTRRGYSVFYDHAFESENWGRDIAEVLGKTFGHRSRYCLMLVSRNYVNKAYPLLEKSHAQGRQLRDSRSEYILQVRLEDVEVPGLPPTLWWVPFRSVENVIELLEQKLRVSKTVLDALDLIVDISRTGDRKAFIKVLETRVLPFQTLAGFSAALAGRAATLCEACLTRKCKLHATIRKLLKPHASVVGPTLLAEYPRGGQCAFTFIREMGPPNASSLFRRIVSSEPTDPCYSEALNEVVRPLIDESSPDDEAAIIAGFRNSPERLLLPSLLLYMYDEGYATTEILRCLTEGTETQRRELLFRSRHSRQGDAFVSVLEQLVISGCSEPAVIEYLVSNGSLVGEQQRNEIVREVNVDSRLNEPEVRDAIIYVRTHNSHTVMNRLADAHGNVLKLRWDNRISETEAQEIKTAYNRLCKGFGRAATVDRSAAAVWTRFTGMYSIIDSDPDRDEQT